MGAKGKPAVPNQGAPVSVFVMTRNEEASIARCLASVRWSNDVVLLDSHSTDRTTDIAAAFPNVRIIRRTFTNFSDQRNFGLNAVDYRNEWALVIDADEVVPEALAAEIRQVAQAAEARSRDAYLVRRLPCLDGLPLRRNISAGFWIARLVRPGSVRYHGLVHERVEVARRMGRLQGYLLHHQFEKGTMGWHRRRLRYARLEGQERRAGERSGSLKDLVGGDTLKRRALAKALYKALPHRWLVYLLYSFVAKAAWLEGRAGLRYAWLEAESDRRCEAYMRKHRRC